MNDKEKFLKQQHSFESMIKSLESMANILKMVQNKDISTPVEETIGIMMEDILANSEYLWIQTGISLPKSCSDKHLEEALKYRAIEFKELVEKSNKE